MNIYQNNRLILVITSDWHSFMNYIRDNPAKGGDVAVFVNDERSLVGRQRKNVEYIGYGDWYKNDKAIKSLSWFLGIPESEIIKNLKGGEKK